MKRILLSVFILIILVISTYSSHPAFISESKWSGTTATPLSSITPEPMPVPETKPTTTLKPIPECIYVTQWNLSLLFGFGDYVGKYTGHLVNGLPSDTGTFTISSENGAGWTYSGEWVNGHFNGSGTMTWEDGFVSSGIYKNDYLNGEGCESLYGATQYQGGFKNGCYHGQGTLYNQHGDIIYSGSFYYGLISESADDKNVRVEAFKILCAAPSAKTLYKSCENGTKQCAKISGTIFDIYYDNIENPTYCDFLIYEQNKSDTSHIICVIYTLSEGEKPPFEDQSITIWGTTEYLYSYTTTDSKTLTVPLIKAFCVEPDS